ncbi:MAG TPA: ABC transporter ATP-binding protein [Candidatus Limnocylindrales bacterium]|jgi:iron complex transport system ATP-binding protein|nr:ABC transporter ATP-binding protein [Candidatus Limnocylindrales bacterium]
MTVLSAERVSLRFGDRDAVAAVSLAVRGGEFVALVGPNGAGKTSLLRVMAGLARPTHGRVLLDDRPLAALVPRERGRRIAFLAPARIAVPTGYRVDEVVGLARFAHRSWWQTTGRDDRAVERALRRFGLDRLRDRRLGTLSDGERQRVWLAALEAQDPEVLLLDEPTSHLDVAHVADTLRALRAWAIAGRAVVAVVHDLDAALAAADRIVVARDGRLVLDAPTAEVAPPAIGAAFDVTLAAAVVARRRRGLVVDYEAER